MKIKMPDITATGVLAIAGLAVGGYFIFKGYNALKGAANWVSDTAGEVADAAISTAKTAVEPLSVDKEILPTSTTKTKPESDWDNAWLNMFAAGGMGA